MARVEGQYTTNQSYPSKRVNFYLDCNKTMAPGYWLAPIKWKGWIDNLEVEFEQTSVSGFAEYHYDFSSFPDNIREAIPHIVEAINDAMRVMD